MAKVIGTLMIMATAGWSLTNGPEQPEYQGFTNSRPKDLVNTHTGDVTYSVPLMEVPGKGDKYSLALEYQSGIPLEMEATWVGLGWNLKTGAITRNLNMYPDDYNMARQRAYSASDDKIRSVNRHIGVNGVYGSWNKRSDNGSTYGFGFALGGFGMHYNSRDGFDMIAQDKASAFDYFMMFTTTAAGAVYNSTVAGLSSQAQAQIQKVQNGVAKFNEARTTALSLYTIYKGYKQGGMSQAINSMALTTVGMGSSSLNLGSMHQESNSFNAETVVGKAAGAALSYFTGGAVNASYGRSDDTYWLKKDEPKNRLHGYLNVGNFDDIRIGDYKMEYRYGGDHEIDADPLDKWSGMFTRGPMFNQNAGMVQTTHDVFQVGAHGLETGFRAYREDIHTYYGQDPMQSGFDLSSDDPWVWEFLGTAWADFSEEFNNFIWNGNMDREHARNQANNAANIAGRHHNKKWKSVDPTTEALNLIQPGLGDFPLYSFREMGDAGGTYQPALFPIFDPGTVFNDCSEGALGECAASKLRSPDALAFPQPNGLPSLPNRISGSSGIFPVFQTLAGLPGISTEIPANTLVGFTMLAKDGKIYEFHKPVFNYKMRSNSYDKEPDANSEEDEDPEKLKFTGIRSHSTMERPYAYAWLLTAVKSPDYVDLTDNGPSYDDFGSWFRFSYGKQMKGYHWRTPYEGALPSGVARNKKMLDIDNAKYTLSAEGQSSWGYKDIAYLTDIHSPTHHLAFTLGDRADGLEAKVEEQLECGKSMGGSVNAPTVHADFLFLNVDDRVLLGDQEYKVKTVASGLAACAGSIGEYCAEGEALVRHNGTGVYRKYGLEKIVPVGGNPNLCGEAKRVLQFVSRAADGAGRNPYALQKIESMRLYVNTGGADGALIQHAQFGYETEAIRELAPNVPNRTGYGPARNCTDAAIPTNENCNGGKLTLRSLALGSGNAMFPPYRFGYYMEGYNAPYAPARFDRWGYYNRNGGQHRPDAETGEDDVIIDHRVNPDDVKAWSLKAVDLPSGASMAMEYESDSYTYVGRARAIEAANFKVEGQVGPPMRMRLVSKEKGPMSVTGAFFTKRGFTVKEIKEAAKDPATHPGRKDPMLRVSSVFRLYRPIDGATGTQPKTQINPVFAEIQRRQGLISKPDEEKRLHLIALFVDNPRLEGLIQTGSPHCAAVNYPDFPNAESPAIIDLGAVDPSMWTFATDPSNVPADKHCQLGYVEFPLSKLHRRNIQVPNSADLQYCMTTFPKVHIDYLGKHYTFAWAYKRDVDKLVSRGGSQQDHDAEWKGQEFYDKLYTVDYSVDAARFSYPSGSARRGVGAWHYLSEMTLTTDEPRPTPGGLLPFEKKHWDYTSIMVHRQIEENSPLKEADGITGGGLRAKRISFNSGWNQESAKPNKFSFTEYAYDCNAGMGGPFSSGATPTVPPPFDNYGDDRILQDPSVSFLAKPPQVGYRTVTEKRKGRGRIVYEFISSADVGDLLEIRALVDAPHYDMRIHRMGQLSGQLWRKTKYSETDEIVAREENKYGLSAPQALLNLAANLSIMNSSDAKRLHEAVVPTGPVQVDGGTVSGTVPYHAGPSVELADGTGILTKEFNHHPASAEHGVTRQRYDMLWYFGSDYGGDDIANPKYSATQYKARVRAEDIEYRVRPYSVERTEKGVGSISVNEYYDFFSGDPLVAVQKPRFDATLPTKSTVSVPAHWMYSSGAGRKFGSIYLGKQWMEVLNNKAPVSSIPYANNLTGIYSTSDYVGLDPMSDEAAWRNQLTGDKLVKQGFVTWGNRVTHPSIFPDHGTHPVWAPIDEFSMRIPLKMAGGVLKADAPNLLGPAATPAQLAASANHIVTNRVNRYDRNLIVLENADANGALTAKFVDSRLREEGLVYNAPRAGSLVATVDAGLPGWTLSGAASSTQDARSGDRSIRFAAVGQSAKTTFPGIDVNRTHQVSFWIKSRSPNPSGGTIQLGAVQKSFAYNHQNLREWQRVSATYLPSELNGIGHVLTIASDKAAEYFVDDIRVAPEDALVFSMTYRDDGKLQSLSDEKDVISYFSYDELGRLMEVKDYQGLIRSTQAQHQAVR